jgi:tetratricopeptide (TPR) repeat protein/predicted Ser/Thr protein kinase
VSEGRASASGGSHGGGGDHTTDALQPRGDVTLATSLGRPAPREPEHAGDLAPGERVGRFTIIEQLGAGGMGKVYAAYDPVLDRRIAIKFVPWRRSDDQGRQRALIEAQAMARLTHPNVVRVYDVGELGRGVFIAMELVEGETLKTWRETNIRTWREILDVMLRAGAGIVAAHSAGLTHRDIKPSNILVGDDGRVLVADFGVARLQLEAAPSEDVNATGSGDAIETPSTGVTRSGADLTVPGAVVGTLAYMAPEQQLGFADNASDQYGFCVTAYEAIYGERPAGFNSLHGRTTAASLVGPTETPAPALPAAGRPPRWLRTALRRGLSANPGARHESMAALIAALSRGAARRRRALVAAAVALPSLAAIAVALGTAAPAPCAAVADGKLAGVWGDEERSRLEAAFVRAGVAFAPDAFARAAGRLDRWASGWRAQRTAICEATWVTREQSQELLDRRMACLDRRLGAARELVHVLSQDPDIAVIQRAVTAVAALPEPATCAVAVGDEVTVEPAPPALRARADRVTALRVAGKFDVGLELARSLVSALPAAELPRMRAGALLELGMLAIEHGASAEAEATLHEAIELAGEIGDRDLAARAASKLVYLVGYVLGRNAEAQTAAVLASALVRNAGNLLSVRSELSIAEAGAKMNVGDYAGARELLGRVLEQHLVEGDDDDPERGRYLSNYGLALHMEGGRDAEAIDYLERGVATQERSIGPAHPVLGDALTNLSMAYERAGRLDEARAVQERAIAIWEGVYGPVHHDIAAGLVNLGSILRDQADLSGARRAFQRAVAIHEQSLGPAHPRTAMSLANLAQLDAVEGRHEQALVAYRRALAIFDAALGRNHPDPIQLLRWIAESELEAGRAVASMTTLTDVLARADALALPVRHEIRLALSRAVWQAERDRARAASLARATRDDTDDAALRAEAAAWLAELDGA